MEARAGVVAAVVAGFGGIISEVGAAMLVGGNIAGQTRVLSTAIVLETRMGEFEFALVLGALLLSLAFLVNILLLRLQHRIPYWPGR
jgi:tungstate transport system permease protein